FKALLFLGAGSVIHGLHDEQDMKRMGALRRWMPITWATFMIGWLAIAGIPPFAGFWSKDEVLLAAFAKSPLLWAVGAVTALLTAYYMTRQVYLVFYGSERWATATGRADHVGHGGHGQPHEPAPAMWVPLAVLAGLSVVGGALNLPFSSATLVLEHWLEPALGGALHHPDVSTTTKVGLAVVAGLLAVIGIVAGRLAWRARRPEQNAGLEPAILRDAWRVDAAYAKAVDGPGRAAAEISVAFDRRVVDGAVDGLAALVRAGGSQLRRAQTGYVRNYALAVASGVVAVLAYTVARV
ncbi:MAG: proton-conducting transporter membrane subunit, partial [Acidimicrobiales bacterium]